MATVEAAPVPTLPVVPVPEAVLVPVPAPPEAGPRPHRITVEEYHRMAKAGVLGREPRIELLDGRLIDKVTKNPPHSLCCELIETNLPRLLPEGWYLASGNPIEIPGLESEPDPDFQIARGQPRDYVGRHRGPGDVGLLIEVAESSYRYDRGEKWLIYARAGVPVYWIADLARSLLEVHSEPSPEGYRSTRLHAPADAVPIVLEGREVARLPVRDILP